MTGDSGPPLMYCEYTNSVRFGHYRSVPRGGDESDFREEQED